MKITLFEAIYLSEVVDMAIQQTKWKAKEKGLEMKTEIQQDLSFVQGDGHRMVQIFINLLDNAIRYTKRGTVSVRMSEENNAIKKTLEDTGIGIPEDEL
jgi:signal transduction histidine kinase